jgi:glutathione peroxidase
MTKGFLVLSFVLAMTMITSAGSIHEMKVTDIDGKAVDMGIYKGKVLLVVNVASKCGFTKQYAGLEDLYQKYKDKGLVVLGVPCNQFKGQEPGTNEEIKAFCSREYNVTFPLLTKVDVNGPQRAPLYEALAGKNSPVPGDIRWNFTKFLIGRDGKVLKRFDSKVTPDSPELVQAVESALAQGK